MARMNKSFADLLVDPQAQLNSGPRQTMALPAGPSNADVQSVFSKQGHVGNGIGSIYDDTATAFSGEQFSGVAQILGG